jgi:hypothetical protein
MCGLEPDDSSGNARQLSSSLITSALPRGNCHLFRIHATKPCLTVGAGGFDAKGLGDLANEPIFRDAAMQGDQLHVKLLSRTQK